MSTTKPAPSAPAVSQEPPEQGSDAPAPWTVVRRRRPGRWALAAVVVLLVAFGIYSIATNRRLQWPDVGHYLFQHIILVGVLRTMLLTVAAMAIGIALGLGLAIIRMGPNPILSGLARAYIWLFRGTPLLVQILFWYNIAALYPKVTFGMPFGPTLASGNANTLITPLTAALLGLGLNEAAYMAEIVRAGLLSVDRGQYEAAAAIGMTRGEALRRIIVPQALKVILPPTGNQTIGMLKATSLVSVISLAELLYSAQSIYNQNFETIALLVVVSIWYLALTTVLTFAFSRLEHRAAKARRHPPGTELDQTMNLGQLS